MDAKHEVYISSNDSKVIIKFKGDDRHTSKQTVQKQFRLQIFLFGGLTIFCSLTGITERKTNRWIQLSYLCKLQSSKNDKNYINSANIVHNISTVIDLDKIHENGSNKIIMQSVHLEHIPPLQL